MKDTKFSIAIHILSIIALNPNPVNSVEIAKSVGTNPSYIRKIMSLLKDLKNSGEIVSLKGLPNRELAKKMNMGLAKELLFNVAARKIEKEAKKRNQNYHFIFVQANGQQLEEAAKILEKNQIHPLIGNQYSLTEVNAALADVAHRKSLGKVIINF